MLHNLSVTCSHERNNENDCMLHAITNFIGVVLVRQGKNCNRSESEEKSVRTITIATVRITRTKALNNNSKMAAEEKHGHLKFLLQNIITFSLDREGERKENRLVHANLNFLFDAFFDFDQENVASNSFSQKRSLKSV